MTFESAFVTSVSVNVRNVRGVQYSSVTTTVSP